MYFRQYRTVAAASDRGGCASELNRRSYCGSTPLQDRDSTRHTDCRVGWHRKRRSRRNARAPHQGLWRDYDVFSANLEPGDQTQFKRDLQTTG